MHFNKNIHITFIYNLEKKNVKLKKKLGPN